jgi:hypothetical protein
MDEITANRLIRNAGIAGIVFCITILISIIKNLGLNTSFMPNNIQRLTYGKFIKVDLFQYFVCLFIYFINMLHYIFIFLIVQAIYPVILLAIFITFFPWYPGTFAL